MLHSIAATMIQGQWRVYKVHRMPDDTLYEVLEQRAIPRATYLDDSYRVHNVRCNSTLLVYSLYNRQ